jgi:hypothetical protein
LTKTIGIPNPISGKNSKTHKNTLKNPLLEKIILTITPKNCPHIHHYLPEYCLECPVK